MGRTRILLLSTYDVKPAFHLDDLAKRENRQIQATKKSLTLWMRRMWKCQMRQPDEEMDEDGEENSQENLGRGAQGKAKVCYIFFICHSGSVD